MSATPTSLSAAGVRGPDNWYPASSQGNQQWNWGTNPMPYDPVPQYGGTGMGYQIDIPNMSFGLNIPNMNFSNSFIGDLSAFANAGGKPTDVTPAWNAAVAQGTESMNDAIRQAAAQYSAGGKRFSSGASGAFGEAGRRAGVDFAAQRTAMELQAQEAARQRELAALNYGGGLQNALQQLMSSYALGKGNLEQSLNQLRSQHALGIGNLQLGEGQLNAQLANQMAANSQNEFNNQMAIMNALAGYGNQIYGQNQSALDRLYSDYWASQQNPYLQYALQFGTAFPGAAAQQSSSPLGGILSGLGSLGLGLMTGGASLPITAGASAAGGLLGGGGGLGNFSFGYGGWQ